jgi:S1-C subfamily serine protease
VFLRNFAIVKLATCCNSKELTLQKHLFFDIVQEALKPVSLGSSSDVAVGQKVYAIGNPFGLDHTLTTGIVSGIHREIQSGITGRPIQDAIQVSFSPVCAGANMLSSDMLPAPLMMCCTDH